MAGVAGDVCGGGRDRGREALRGRGRGRAGRRRGVHRHAARRRSRAGLRLSRRPLRRLGPLRPHLPAGALSRRAGHRRRGRARAGRFPLRRALRPGRARRRTPVAAAVLPGAEPSRHVAAQRAGAAACGRASGPRGGSARSTIPTQDVPEPAAEAPGPRARRGGPDARRRRVRVGGDRAARRAVQAAPRLLLRARPDLGRGRSAVRRARGHGVAQAGESQGGAARIDRNGAGRPRPADERRGQLGRGRAAGLGRGAGRGARRGRPGAAGSQAPAGASFKGERTP